MTRKPISTLTNKDLVKEYKLVHKKIRKVEMELIKQGLGGVKPSDLMRGRDTIYASNKTVREYLALSNYASEIKWQAELRYGPDMKIIDQLIWK